MQKTKVFRKALLCLSLAGTLFFNSTAAWAGDSEDWVSGDNQNEEMGFSGEASQEWTDEDGTGEEILSGWNSDEQGVWEESAEADNGKISLTEEEREAQLAPIRELTPISFCENPDSIMDGDTGSVGASRAASLPARYDTRGSISSSVKNQKPSNMCWAYTLAANLETSFLRKNMGSYDLSEEHLAYFFANRVNDPLGNTASDRNNVLHDYRDGGNQTLGAIFLSTWSGMALESQVPYVTNADHTADSKSVPAKSMAYQTAAYLENAVFTSYSVSRIKNLIYEYGSVSLSFQMSDIYYNPDTCAYSYPLGTTGVNHAVTLIGWDDNYSRDNFAAESRVKNNGAWIAKNSWGTGWGYGGYFYISYENTSNYSMVAAEAAAKPSYKNNYFYDGSSALSKLTLSPSGNGGTSSVANVYTANAGNGKGESLGEVVLSTYTDGGTYSIQIYTNLTDANNPESGVPAYSSPVQHYQKYAGISTVRVPEVTLMQGTRYSVVVTNTGTNSVEYLCETNSSYEWVTFQAGLKAGQSFYYSEASGWKDCTGISACARIKAHTRTLGSAVSAAAPTGVKVSAKEYNQIAVSWNPVSGASGCEIYRKKSGDNYTKVGTVSYKYSSFTDKKAVPGTQYTYKVRTYYVVNGQAVYSGFSRAVSGKSALSVPKVSVTASASLYNRVSWNQIPGAQGYVLYRRTDGEWKKLAVIKGGTSVSYDDKNILPVTTYEYGVRAYRVVNQKKIYSSYQSSGAYKSAPALQKVSSVTKYGAGFRIRWNPQKTCDGYRIYRNAGDGKWTCIAVIPKGSTSSYTDKTVEKGKKYAYRVRAFVKEPYGTVYSKYKTSAYTVYS